MAFRGGSVGASPDADVQCCPGAYEVIERAVLPLKYAELDVAPLELADWFARNPAGAAASWCGSSPSWKNDVRLPLLCWPSRLPSALPSSDDNTLLTQGLDGAPRPGLLRGLADRLPAPSPMARTSQRQRPGREQAASLALALQFSSLPLLAGRAFPLLSHAAVSTPLGGSSWQPLPLRRPSSSRSCSNLHGREAPLPSLPLPRIGMDHPGANPNR